MRAAYGALMWSAKVKEDAELLALFEESARNVQRASCLLRDLYADYPERAEIAEQVLACEHEGDRIAHEILSRVAERGAADLDATDVHALAGALDDIVDHAEEAADELGRYGVEAPLEAAEALAEVLDVATGHVESALGGFRTGGEILSALTEIHRLEHDADELARDAVSSLFAAGIDPMMVIRWKDILETLEAAVDACQTVASVLEGATLKLGGRLERAD